LLLDDALSELDARRRRLLLERAQGVEQVLLTSTHRDDVPVPGHRRFRVEKGALLPDP
jgi:recombinational DNA repair ATPase RecF